MRNNLRWLRFLLFKTRQLARGGWPRQLATVQFLACSAIRSPADASDIRSGEFLERIEMVVSETQNRMKTRTLQVCILLCAMVVLPCGMAPAQDFEAVGKRLRAAVEAGELTGEQARGMLGTLRKSAEHRGERNAPVEDERVAKYRGIAVRIKAAVEAGQMSKEDAEKMAMTGAWKQLAIT